MVALPIDVLRAMAFEALPVHAVVLDRRGTIVLDNLTGRAGMPFAETRGRRYAEVCTELYGYDLDPSTLDAGIEAVLAGRKAVTLECRGRNGRSGRAYQLMLRRLRGPGFDGLVVLHLDITEQRRAEELAWHRALHDPLTGLANRSLLQDRLANAIAAVKRHFRPIALALFDCDDFKDINDSFGHQAGDEVLIELARRATRVVRGSDTVARLGGDEFALILGDVEGPGAAGDTVGKVLRRLSAPMSVGGERLQVHCSAGIALCPVHGFDPEQLMAKADKALYEAKREGGGLVVTYRAGRSTATGRRERAA